MSQRDEILALLPNIPALPAAATRVITMLQDPETGIADIMDAVELDPGLTTDVLRLANSAFFAGPRKISTLREAGVLFGTKRLLDVVLASAVFPIVRRPVRGYDLPPGELLNHLVAVAVGSEKTAEFLQIPVPPSLFTAGLLHDIGKIVLGTFAEVDVRPIAALARQENISFEIAERQYLGIDHAEIGALLLEAWQFPEEIILGVRHHHKPDEVEGPYQAAMDALHVADIVGIECGLGAGLDGLQYRMSEGTIQRLGLKIKTTEQITCIMLNELEKVRSQFPEGGA